MPENSNSKYRAIFIFILSLPKFKYKNKELAKWSGFHDSKISRFLNGQHSLTSTEFFYLLESMPQSFQRLFWMKYHSKKISKAQLDLTISELNLVELGTLLEIVTEKINKLVNKL